MNLSKIISAFLVCLFVILTSLAPLPSATANDTEPFSFITMVRCDTDQILVSWERVPFASSYIVHTGNEDKTLSSDWTMYTFAGDDVPDNFSVEAVDSNGNVIANSLTTVSKPFGYLMEWFIELEFQIDNYMYWHNGTMIGPMDTPPVVKNGRSFLVIRYITEVLGCDIAWDGSERKVSITNPNGTTIDLWIDNPVASVNGNDVYIDENDHSVAPFIAGGRTMLPLRFVADKLGAFVEWDGENKKIGLTWAPDSFITYSRIQLTANAYEIYDDNIYDKYGYIEAYDSLGNIFHVPSKNTITKGIRFTIPFGLSNIQSDNGRPFAILGVYDIHIIEEQDFISVTVSEVGDGVLKSVNNSSLSFDETLDGIHNIKKGSIVNLGIDEDEIIWWEYDTNCVCEDDPNGNVLLYLDDACILEGSIHIRDDYVSESTETISSQFIFPTPDTTIIPNGCYDIIYARNWLGRNVIISAEQVTCPYVLDISDIESGGDIVYGGGRKSYFFSVTNNGLSRIDTEGFVSCDDFPGDIKIVNEHIQINPGESHEIEILIKPDKDAEGMYTVDYGVILDEDEKITESFTIEVVPNNFDYEVTSDLLVLPVNMWVYDGSFDIVNNHSDPLDLILSVKDSDILYCDLKTNTVHVNGNDTETVKYTINSKSVYNKCIGERISLTVICQDNIQKNYFEIPIQVIQSLHPLPNATFDINESDRTVTVYCDPEWYCFPSGYIELLWGDGSKVSDASDFPYTHTYSRNGSYQISLIANSDKNQSGYRCLGWQHYMVKINKKDSLPDFTNINVEFADDLVNLTLTCDINWKGHKPDDYKVMIFWGDGLLNVTLNPEQDLNEDSGIVHEYQRYHRWSQDMNHLIQIMLLDRDSSMHDIPIKTFCHEVTIKGSGK